MRGDIVVYGAEDRQGRGLFAVSAIHHCARWLAEQGIGVRFVAVTDFVAVAAEVLSAQTGLATSIDASTPRGHPEAVFTGAGLYIGVVFSRTGELALDEAERRQVRCIAAVQFPEPRQLSPSVIENMRCAFDPVELSRRVQKEIVRSAKAERLS